MGNGHWTMIIKTLASRGSIIKIGLQNYPEGIYENSPGLQSGESRDHCQYQSPERTNEKRYLLKIFPVVPPELEI
jgi:hypothetical protein